MTVSFPAVGFYPIEIDYAEDGGGGLNKLSLALRTGDLVNHTPIPNGPSPTVTSQYNHSLILLGVALVLGGCGQVSGGMGSDPLAPGTPPLSTPTVFIYITPTPLHGLPGPDVLRAENDAAATREALTPVPTWPPGVPRVPPATLPPETPVDMFYLTRPVGAGLLYDESVAPDLPSTYGNIINQWVAETPNQVIHVYAGAKQGSANSNQGVAVVRIYDRATKHYGDPFIYETPLRAGRVRIVDGSGMQLTLQASNGTLFYFDAAAQHWITTPASPAPSPGVSPGPSTIP